MTVCRLLVISPLALCLLALPCQAGPCSTDVERIQVRIDTKLNAIAAAGPAADQSTAAQMHRQPTPGSIAQAEQKLGELSPDAIAKVKDAMTRARGADAAGDAAGCQRALDEVEREIGSGKRD
jgi:hypothetical protein